MARKNLDLSWMDQAPKPKEEDKKARREPPPEPPPCSTCGDGCAWWGYKDDWYCEICAPYHLRHPTEANAPKGG